jgi:hypothetical protein
VRDLPRCGAWHRPSYSVQARPDSGHTAYINYRVHSGDMGNRSSSFLTALQHAAAESRTVAQTCRYFGISRKTFYKWKGRFSRHGETGPSDQSRPAHRSRKDTPSEVVNKILYLRQQYRCGAGPIADWSRRQRWQRYEKPQPGHRLQVDVKCPSGFRTVGSGSSSSRRSTTARASASPSFRPTTARVPITVSMAPGDERRAPRLHPLTHAASRRQVERSHRVDAREPASEKFS